MPKPPPFTPQRLHGYACVSLLALALPGLAQQPAARTSPTSIVWSPDLGDGRYKNPVLYADYSDPDAIRVGEDFYLVSSSFNDVPGLPILHSRDLVNWEIVAHVFTEQPPAELYRTAQHGTGVWAPALRFHNGSFFLFYPDPDFGIYMTKAESITGPWSPPLLIKEAKGWIDPCPLWDDDGKAWLVNGLAASRAGIKSTILLSRMAPNGTHLLGDASIIVDGHDLDPTLEGPKIYKRHGFYYIFAPAGGVPKGWQVIFRSRSIAGPYERRKVLAQGNTSINGPHQGAWVDTGHGEDWFLHFQDQGPYGRVVNLEPMRWENDWPVMGEHISPEGLGEPVSTYRKPAMPHPGPAMNPADSDEFNASELGPQWQWTANPQPSWAFPSSALGVLRLVDVPPAGAEANLWKVPNLLLQKLPGPQFTLTTKVAFKPSYPGEETGVVVMGQSYAYIGLVNTATGPAIRMVHRQDAQRDGKPVETAAVPVSAKTIYLRARMDAGAVVHFSYSQDGATFTPLGPAFQATPGRWIGAKIGLFAKGAPDTKDTGYADYDWFRFDR